MSEENVELTALKWRTVEHWLENWKDPESASIYARECAYCCEFETCSGCPIGDVIHPYGFLACEGTPWVRVRNAQEKYWDKNNYAVTLSELRNAIEMEYRFVVAVALGDYKEAESMLTVKKR